MCIPVEHCILRDTLALRVYSYLKNNNFCELLNDDAFLDWMGREADNCRRSCTEGRFFRRIAVACEQYLKKPDKNDWRLKFVSASGPGGSFFELLENTGGLNGLHGDLAITGSYYNLFFYIGLLALDKIAARAPGQDRVTHSVVPS